MVMLASLMYIHLSNLAVQVVVYTLYEICQMLIHRPWSSDHPRSSPSDIQVNFLSRPMNLATYVLEQGVCYLLDLSEYVSFTGLFLPVSMRL
jgi:hypothetical protein